MPPPGPEDVFGPMLIGLLLDAILLGALAVQVIQYFYRYRRDRWWFKLLVAYLFLVDIVNTACDFGTVWEPLILKFGSRQAVGQAPHLLPADPVTTTLISTPVQLFMAWRLRIITKSKIIPVVIVLFSFCSLGGGAWLSYNIFHDTIDEIRSSMTQKASSTWLISSAVTDVLITIAIVYIMVTRRKGTNADLNNHLGRVMRLTVEAGAVTTFAVISALIVFMTVHQGPYFLIWDLSISKLYSLSLITSLNARPVRQQFPKEKAALFPDQSSNTPTTKQFSGMDTPTAGSTWIHDSDDSTLTPRTNGSSRFPPRSASLFPASKSNIQSGGQHLRHNHDRGDSGSTMTIEVERGEQFEMQPTYYAPAPVKF
ncbi:hypothetical protein Moror_4274 [Moniliophthora roreri MCA 2997]|uniref:DUF6534 domain-containing protein n=1 Tax=Moniliophthora roreri (strain MCA 2997) TaxID=1381753 RepID=V2YFV5_MONRO|nr:hypothetical protein Moror_4274 [Moniliophthora roreri MCA 2997]